jgi:hypothetical protein
VPIAGEGVSALTVQEQMDIVQDMVTRMQEVLRLWDEVQKADNVIVEMMTRADLEEKLVALEEDVRRHEAEGAIRYVPSERRMQNEVIDPITLLRQELLVASGRGPSADTLKEILKSMERHREKAEYALMLDAFKGIEDRLELVESDPLRKPLVERLRKLAFEARTVLDFEKIDIEVTGLAIIEGARSRDQRTVVGRGRHARSGAGRARDPVRRDRVHLSRSHPRHELLGASEDRARHPTAWEKW